jgi:hypothetical protein
MYVCSRRPDGSLDYGALASRAISSLPVDKSELKPRDAAAVILLHLGMPEEQLLQQEAQPGGYGPEDPLGDPRSMLVTEAQMRKVSVNAVCPALGTGQVVQVQ